jgi:uncharacterized membrane protein required for colicin V production
MIVILVVAAAVIAFCAIEGLRHGIVRRLVEFLGLIAVFLLASRSGGWLAPRLSDVLPISPKVAFFCAWILVIVLGIVLVRLLARGIAKLFSFSIIGWLDKGGGFALGAAFGGVVASCLLILLLALPVSDDFRIQVREHPGAATLLWIAPAVYDGLNAVLPGDSFAELIDDYLEPQARAAVQEVKAFFLEREAEDEQ